MLRYLKNKTANVIVLFTLIAQLSVTAQANPIRKLCRTNPLPQLHPICLKLKDIESFVRQDREFLAHIHGKITINQDREYRIAGGLHTLSGLMKFTQIRTDLDYKTEILPNGVIKAILPAKAFHAKSWKKMEEIQSSDSRYLAGTKTLFPKEWGDEEIIDSIVDLLVLEDSIPSKGAHTLIREHGSIRISIQIWNGKIISAFPWFDQAS